ncbi:MAG: tetratricopeptide repeat protein [Anaerolineaceae bacterium]|nr:tetratricopeptide repeat protein [Anaerolineaceae bacterium]
MTRISLRGYNREIEALIDRGKNDEAIGHCKHILKFFPKHVDTYRLLGKAYLESQRYTESADIFQRVLSVIPDDFVSQIGLSIIKEDEGNLDAAIWHIERAFEIQPSNAAIQEELRRLFGRRDGIQLTKIRLTRGALIRMYMHGELFPQAIAETRATLAEDPGRIDLEIILARLYYLSGKKIEATATCSNIINKLPYCYEVNKILAVILQGTERANDAKIFQQRILSIEPYAAHVSKNAPTISQVHDNAVTLERLEWEPSRVDDDQPEWARTVGIEFKKVTTDELPEWLPATSDVLSPTTNSVQETNHFAEEVSGDEGSFDLSEPQDSEEIPGWMKTAGWVRGTEDSEVQSEEIFEFGEKDAIPADVPDWLQSIAPELDSDQQGDEDKEKLDLLDRILPVPEVEIPDGKIEQVSTYKISEEENILEDGVLEETPVWLLELAAPGEDIPEPILPSAEEFPEKLDETKETQSKQAEIVEEKILVSQEDEIDEAISWLESLAASQGAEQDTLISSPEQRMEKPPDWIMEQLDSEKVEYQVEKAETSLQEYEEESDELPIATSDISEIAEPESEIGEEEVSDQGYFELEEPSAEIQENDDLPEWLRDLESDEEPLVTAPASIDQSTGWIPADTLSEEHVTETEELTELQEKPRVDLSSPPTDDIDDAIAWLESLAEKQGADRDTLISSPEDRIATPPDWLKDQITSIEATSEVDEDVLPKPADLFTTEALEEIDLEESPIFKDFDFGDQTFETPFESRTTFPEETPSEQEQISQEHAATLPKPTADSQEMSDDLNKSMEWLESLAEDIEPTVEELISEDNYLQEPIESIPEEQELPDVPLIDKQEIAAQEDEPDVTEMEAQLEPAEDIDLVTDLVDDEELSDIDTLTQHLALVSDAQETPLLTPHFARENAFQTLMSGDKGEALEQYEILIQDGELIGGVIEDLEKSLEQYPIDVDIWQTLGDAYAKSNRLQDALDAYTRAEEFLR